MQGFADIRKRDSSSRKWSQAFDVVSSVYDNSIYILLLLPIILIRGEMCRLTWIHLSTTNQI
jgi:hypothetical protein